MLIYKYEEGAVTITPPAHAVARVSVRAITRRMLREEEEEEETEVINNSPVTNALIPERYQVQTTSRNVKDRPQIAFSPCSFIEFPRSSPALTSI